MNKAFSKQYDFSGHNISPGLVMGLGSCTIPINAVPSPAKGKSMRKELNFGAKEESIETTKQEGDLAGGIEGCFGSGMRTLRATAWLLQGSENPPLAFPADIDIACDVEDQHFPCVYIAPNSSTLSTRAASADLSTSHAHAHAIATAYRRQIHLLPFCDDYTVDSKLHGEPLYSGHPNSAVRLVEAHQLKEAQVRALRDIMFECTICNPQMQKALSRAHYVLLTGTTLAFGHERLSGPGDGGANDSCATLCVFLDQCARDNRCVLLSLVGCTFSSLARAGLSAVLQFVDVLFITELEARRLAFILTYQPGKSLTECALFLAAFAKVSGMRARLVLVVPNPPLRPDTPPASTPSPPPDSKCKTRFDAAGRQIYREFEEYDPVHVHNPDELQGRVLVASCEEFFYIPGWPTEDRNDSLIGSATGSGMSTYYYSSHIDLRVDIGRTHQQSPKRASAAAGAAEIHLARADNFVGGFLGMMVRAEQQINMQHGELTSHSTSTSFIQGTLPNERMVELARERSLRLQRERELALPGRPQPPVLRTPKTSTPQLNPGKQRVGLTGTDRKTLFQSPESRQRNALSTAGRPAMQLSVDAWGNHENDENQNYSEASMIKWASAGPTAALNIVSGRRLVYECVQAGLYVACEFDQSYRYFESADAEASSSAEVCDTCKFFELFV